jgi:hypothetical protein
MSDDLDRLVTSNRFLKKLSLTGPLRRMATPARTGTGRLHGCSDAGAPCS